MGHDETAACGCVSDHRPPPLEYERHHVWPLYLGGPDTADNLVWVCPTTHTNTHEILRAMLKFDRAMLYGEVRAAQAPRVVSRYAYELAARGFALWRSAVTV